MTTSKSNGAYDMLISLRDKLTCLNDVITSEAVDKLKDELGGIFTVTKTELVFFGWYRSVFLGMYDTITEGNLGQYVCSRSMYVGMTPFRKCLVQVGSHDNNKTHPGGKAD